MFEFLTHNRPGKGVQKRDPNQPRTNLFFELLFSKLSDLCRVNFAYILLAIPTYIITMIAVGTVTSRITEVATPLFAELMGIDGADMSNVRLNEYIATFDITVRVVFTTWFMVFLGLGPATAGVTYTLRNYAREEHTWLWSETWRNVKVNFKQATLLWIMDLAIFILTPMAFDYYRLIGTLGVVILAVLIALGVLYLMMHVYVYQIMITFELPFKNVLKNAAIMSLMTAPKTLLMILILAAVHILAPCIIVLLSKGIVGILLFILLEVVFLLAGSAFMTNFFIYPTVEKYIKQALEMTENSQDVPQNDE